jgi:pyrroline-5-carboxylate reductase
MAPAVQFAEHAHAHQYVMSAGARAVVRSMPNTPAMIAQGMTMWCQSKSVTPEQHMQACTTLHTQQSSQEANLFSIMRE